MKYLLLKPYVLWLPKWWLIVLVTGLGGGLFILAAKNIAFYLAVNQPVYGEYLVVEGWQNKSSLKKALAVFNNRENTYRYLITTGGPDKHSFNPQYKTYAERAAFFLIEKGLSKQKIIILPSPASAQDRTFLSAVIVRGWFEKEKITSPSLDVFSQDVHTRRSVYLYKKAFLESERIGSYASFPADYDLRQWWKTSTGAKAVITEFIGLLWVKCCFHSGDQGSYQERWGIKKSNVAQ